MIVDHLIKSALEKGAIHIHIAPNAKPIFRMEGYMEQQNEEVTLRNDDVQNMLHALCDSTQLDLLNQTGELNFGYSLTDVGRLRVNVVRQRGSYGISIRIHKTSLPERKTLGLPESLFDKVVSHSGLLIVCGPSGSGRSTTLASLLQYINENHCAQIITIESPIEYLLRHDKSIVLQRDVGTDCLNVVDGLQSTILHNPDVVMVTDLNDEASIDLALKIAETGKLVIAGFNSISAVGALERILFSESSERKSIRRHQVSTTLLGILAQQLVPDVSKNKRILAYELLLSNATIKAHLMANQLSEVQNALIAGKRQGMMAMDTHLFELFQSNRIDYETLIRYCHDGEYIKRLEKTVGK